jgi:hypothetical protein
MFPITDFVVEDIMATTKKNALKWDLSFSPLKVVNKWLYQTKGIGHKVAIQGFENYKIRQEIGIEKSSKKLAKILDYQWSDL